MDSTLRIIVTGLIAQYPLGGVTWDYVQYVLGLQRLGHDVYYFEDTGQWPYNPTQEGTGKDCAYNVRYLDELMKRFGLSGRWAYCFPWQDQWFGLSQAARRDVVGSADLLINISGTLRNPWAYRAIPRLAYIDSDPTFTQIKLARGQHDFRRLVDTHDVIFSFGERVGETLPRTGHTWLPTRQPVVLDAWAPAESTRNTFTTVMNWTSYKPVEFEGRTYGQKDKEFRKFIDLPSVVRPGALEIAVNEGKTRRTPWALLRHKGWNVVRPNDVCAQLDDYRDYLRSSKAEWSVAKNGYVVGQSGWFSCRSACYLAAGRPVVVEDTGFSCALPVGTGILPFRTLEQAAEAIREVEARYDQHARAAREIAETYFASDTVLTRLLEQTMSGAPRGPGKEEPT